MYTRANKDWLISAELPEGAETLESDHSKEAREMLLAALSGDDLSEHDARQAQLLFRAFTDTKAREKAGCSHSKKVIDDIRSLSDISELDAFLLDTERSAGVPTLIEVRNAEDTESGKRVCTVTHSELTFSSSMTTIGADIEGIDPDTNP